MADIAYLKTDHVLRFFGVRDIDGNPQTNADVVVAGIFDNEDQEVTGQNFPVTAVHRGGGDYDVPLSDSLALQLSGKYQARGTITIATGDILTFRHEFTAQHYITSSP